MSENRDTELGDLLRQADEAPPLGADFDARLWTRIESEANEKLAAPRLSRLSPRLWRRRWGGRTLAVLLAGAVLLAAGTVYAARLVVGGTSATPTHTIAFTKVMPNGDQEIYLVRTDGSGLKRLTHTDSPATQSPAWSPDGGKIAFLSAGAAGAPSRTAWVVNADGSGQRQVDPSGYGRMGSVNGVDWSPDGSRMVVTMDDGRQAGLAVINADGGGFRMVVSEPEPAEFANPAWAPDGRIFFSRAEGDPGVAAVSSIDADGSGLTDVTVLPIDTYDHGFSLSRDGRWLALFDSRERCAVYMAADGHGGESAFLEAGRAATVVRPLGDLAGVASSWSPDGMRIAFAASGALSGSGSALYIVRMDGSGLRKVPNTGLVLQPAWQPRR
jgi:dipeptidyl aminopeptidase/acylaminoacyl peptidase